MENNESKKATEQTNPETEQLGTDQPEPEKTTEGHHKERKVKELTKEIDQLREQVANLQKQNWAYEADLKRQQAEFIDKLKAKAKEAQALVDEKRAEVDAKFLAEVEARKTKIYTKEMLGIIDAIEQFELIVQAPVSDPKLAGYVSGFKMILTMFENELTAMGFTKVQIRVGDTMDPNLMQAFEVVEVDGFQSHQVVEVIRNAYKYKDTIIKHAVVKVQK